MNDFKKEVQKGQRFEFGKNWKSFLLALNEDRIKVAEDSLKEMLMINDLKGKRFLDIGSGSGLFSLAARRLGAEVHSFDYDPNSVACTNELRSKYFPNDLNWKVDEGSILDEYFLTSLGRFDIVYSWGVLHHTGKMWEALSKASSIVESDGVIFIAIYNDEGKISRIWHKIKRIYCSSILGKFIITCIFIPIFFTKQFFLSILKKENIFQEYKKNRGMSIYHDWFDWLGGYPFEFAKVEDIFCFFRDKGFKMINIKNFNGKEPNQFVFIKE